MALSIVMTASFWDALYCHLIRVTPENAYPNEQFAFILASMSKSPLGTRLLACEMILANPSDLLRQSTVVVEPKPVFVAPVLRRCRTEGWSLIEVHSHPFDKSEHTAFSSVDWETMRRKMPGFAHIISEPFMHVTMVMGQKALDAQFYNRQTDEIVPVEQIIVVGNTLRYIPTTSYRRTISVKETDERYARQQFLDQQRITNTTVAIVGLGGFGSLVALQLAHLGVGHLVLVDHDIVERTNLNRLIGASTVEVGKKKVEVYARLIRGISPNIQITTIPVSLIDRKDNSAREYVKGADVIFGCVDNDGTRLILNQIAIRYMIPLIDGGAIIQLTTDNDPQFMGGQVQVVLPGSGCLECRGFINPQRAYFDLAPQHVQEEERAHGYGTKEEAPSVISLNGVLSSLQVSELLFLLSISHFKGTSAPPLTSYSTLERKVIPVIGSYNEHCPTCSSEGVVGIGDLSPIKLA